MTIEQLKAFLDRQIARGIEEESQAAEAAEANLSSIMHQYEHGLHKGSLIALQVLRDRLDY